MFGQLKKLWSLITGKKAIQLEDIASMSIDQLKEAATLIHPAGYYVLANRLFHEDYKDEAIFWFYVGSLRFRYYLSSIETHSFHPEVDLFERFQFEIGYVLLDYAGGNPVFWAEQIAKAAAWDDDNDNVFFDKRNDPATLLEVRQGMRELHNKLIDEKDDILRQRLENNAEVRA